MKFQRTTVILLSLILLNIAQLKAQTNEGTIRYLVVSNWSKMMASVDYISKQQRDRNMYMWGNRSEWKSYQLLHFNQYESKFENSDEEAEIENSGWKGRKETFFMIRNFKDNTMYDGITFLGKTYLIHDTINPLPWKILNDMKEVAGHICMNATYTDTLRNQVIIAWFALDMPITSGPNKFVGLPGIILELDINNGAKTYIADKIDFKSLKNELDAPAKLKGKKINSLEYNNIINKHIKEKKENEEPWFWGMPY